MSEIRLEVKIDGVKYPLVTKESKENIENIATGQMRELYKKKISKM